MLCKFFLLYYLTNLYFINMYYPTEILVIIGRRIIICVPKINVYYYYIMNNKDALSDKHIYLCFWKCLPPLIKWKLFDFKHCLIIHILLKLRFNFANIGMKRCGCFLISKRLYIIINTWSHSHWTESEIHIVDIT